MTAPVLLTLGLDLLTSARNITFPEFDKAPLSSGQSLYTIEASSAESSATPLSFLAPVSTSRNRPHVTIAPGLIWGTRETSADLVARPLNFMRVHNPDTGHDLVTSTTDYGGASYANLSYRLVRDNASYTKLLTTGPSTEYGGPPGRPARTSPRSSTRSGPSGGKFVGELHLQQQAGRLLR